MSIAGKGAIFCVALALSGSPASVTASPPESKGSSGVAVSTRSDGKRVACPPLRGNSAGGCVLSAYGQEISMDLRSVIGDLHFGTCYVDFTLRVDPNGRSVLDDILVYGDSPCSDAVGCFTGDDASGRGDTPPWKGQLLADPNGDIVNVANACFDTCMGRFTGDFTITIQSAARRAIAHHAQVGSSGWRLDGIWNFRGPQIVMTKR